MDWSNGRPIRATLAHGRLPYRDFFFPQTPLGPFTLAPFAAIAARFVMLRLATALFAAGAATLVAHAVHRESRSRSAAVVGTLLFVTHALTWRWLPTLRPYALGEFSDAASAIVQAFMPGQGAGPAIAGVLSGRVNPSGRLPVQIPAVPYGQPSTYLQSAYGLPGLAASSISVPVLYPFGHGLSYTSFEISNLSLSATTLHTDGRLSVSATITNTGARRGADVVQLYYSDPLAEVARPVIMLLGFVRVDLDAGEQADVTFEVSADRFAYCGRQGRIVDSGTIELMLGHSSTDIAHRALVEVTGTTRVVGSERTLTTPVTVQRSVRSTDPPAYDLA